MELARAELPDLILLDVMLPGETGWDVAAALAEDASTREIPIVFLTAMADESDLVRGRDARRGRLHHEAVRPGRARRDRWRDARAPRARRARAAALGDHRQPVSEALGHSEPLRLGPETMSWARRVAAPALVVAGPLGAIVLNDLAGRAVFPSLVCLLAIAGATAIGGLGYGLARRPRLVDHDHPAPAGRA